MTIVPRHSTTQLRGAAIDDEPFLRALYETVRRGDFIGLPQSTVEMLLEQQYRIQAKGYAAQFPDAISMIVLRRDEPVGRLMLVEGKRCWHLVDIMLMPSVRGQGIGTDLIGAIVQGAAAAGASQVTLSVRFDNTAARRLYRRLGFVEIGGGVHIPMARCL